MSKRIVSQDLGYNEGFNELVVTHPETKVTTLSASTAYVNNKKSSSQGVRTRVGRPRAITDLADASYFFALGAKVQARKPGRPSPFDLVDPRAQRGRRAESGAPMRQIDPFIFPWSTKLLFLPEVPLFLPEVPP